VHEECERIAAEVAPSFLLNTWTNEGGHAVRLYTGDWRTAHRLACAEYADAHTIPIAEKRPIVIASCGGWPHDLNLIQAHKTLDMAARACTEGGTIILLAECPDGAGRADFLQWFDAENSYALASRLRDSYAVNGQTAWALLTKTESFNVRLISQLDEREVRHMRMTPMRTIEDALADFSGKDVPGFVLPFGARLMPVVIP
jgi:nickel-dependent lactate racemase